MRTEGQTVFVPWYGKVLQGNVVRENDMMGMTAVRIPLQGQHPIALFTPGHVYDTADDAENSKSVPKIAQSVPKVAETSQCEAFRKSPLGHRAQPPQNGLPRRVLFPLEDGTHTTRSHRGPGERASSSSRNKTMHQGSSQEAD